MEQISSVHPVPAILTHNESSNLLTGAGQQNLSLEQLREDPLLPTLSHRQKRKQKETDENQERKPLTRRREQSYLDDEFHWERKDG